MVHPVLVVEDDRKIANVVRVYLQEGGFRVLLFEKGGEALEAAIKERPLAVILDLMLPDRPGEEICQELKELGDIPVIMLTSKQSEEERVAGFALGADDYVVKPFSPRELLWRLRAVLRRRGEGAAGGGQEGEPMSFNHGALRIDPGTFEVKKEGEPVKLTGSEMKVLLTLAGRAGKIFTREELVERALGYQFEGYERSIDAHIKNIRKKIEPDPRQPVFILTVYGVGYRFSGRPDEKK